MMEEQRFSGEPWHPTTDPKALKVLGKLAEEAAELTAICARCIIQGPQGTEPLTRKRNLTALAEEIADVMTNMDIAISFFDLDTEMIRQRHDRKTTLILSWLKGA